jgi:hypothetical protein
VNKNENWKFINKSKSTLIFTWFILFVLIVGYISGSFSGSFYVLFKNKNNLKDKGFIETYGEIMQGLNSKNKNSIYIYPVFMLKRLIFSLIVLIFCNKPAFQLQALIILQFSHVVFIIKTKSCRLFR